MPENNFDTISFIDNREVEFNKQYSDPNGDYRIDLLADLTAIHPQIGRWAEERIQRSDTPNLAQQLRLLETAVIIGETVSDLKALQEAKKTAPIVIEKPFRIPAGRRRKYRLNGSAHTPPGGLNRLSRIS